MIHPYAAGADCSCEDFLGLASWLALKDAANTTHLMRSQLSRLFGQLYSLQGKFDNAIHAFSEDMYYCSLEYGPQDLRTSLGYYNLAKVFQNKATSPRRAPEPSGVCCVGGLTFVKGRKWWHKNLVTSHSKDQYLC